MARSTANAMLKDAVRRRFDVLMAWSANRLGRSLLDLISALQKLHGAGVDLFLHQQAVDTTTPAGRAMFQMLGVFAEFERAMIQARVKAGLARARQRGTRSGRPFGRPTIPAAKDKAIRRYLSAGTGILKTAKLVGVGSGTVQRVRREMQKATRRVPSAILILAKHPNTMPKAIGHGIRRFRSLG